MKAFLNLQSKFYVFILSVVIAFHSSVSFALSTKVIGQIESVYLQRASLRVLELLGPASETSPVSIGQKISFNLPTIEKKGKKQPVSVEFGKVYEVELEGTPITEYSSDENATKEKSSQIYVWTATRIDKVKNQKKYIQDSDKKGKGKRDKKNRKEKEPPKIWTQQEAVRGKLLLKNNKLYIKEEDLRPRDKGLHIISEEWCEKLKPYVGQTVILSGTTHRTSPASGTMEVENILKFCR